MAGFKVTIDKKTWKVEIEAEGYTGESCITDIDALMDAMGAETEFQWTKPELYEGEVVVQNPLKHKA